MMGADGIALARDGVLRYAGGVWSPQPGVTVAADCGVVPFIRPVS